MTKKLKEIEYFNAETFGAIQMSLEFTNKPVTWSVGAIPSDQFVCFLTDRLYQNAKLHSSYHKHILLPTLDVLANLDDDFRTELTETKVLVIEPWSYFLRKARSSAWFLLNQLKLILAERERVKKVTVVLHIDKETDESAEIKMPEL